MKTKSIRPRRTEINRTNRFFLWGKKNGLDLARYDFSNLDTIEEKKQSTFKNNPEAKKHNYKFLKI